jgi:CHAD domain-containing protein
LDPDGWPADVRSLVTGYAGDAARLRPYAILRQERDEYRVLPADALSGDGTWAPLAVLSVDDALVYEPERRGRNAVTADGVLAGRFGELEIELRPGGEPAALREMAKRLRAAHGLSPSGDSKLARALDILADYRPAPRGDGVAEPVAAPAGITPELDMAEAGRLMWRRQLAAMLLNEAGARRGDDIEYVHDMRVATRRARAVARLFGPYFKPKAIADFLDELKRTARALGAVRDLDVALAKLAKHARLQPEDTRDGYMELAAEWRVERRHANRELLERLDSREHRAFVAAFAAFCHSPGAGARTLRPNADGAPPPQQVRHVMPSAILRHFEQVRCYEPLFESGDEVPHTTLHAMRIDCKALRYSIEPVEHLLGDEGAGLVKQLKALQDLLGDLNDAAVAEARLEAIRAAGSPPAGLAPYLAHQQALQADLAARVPAAWRTFTGPENRRRVGQALARM